jgi:hypothetical protein
MTQNKLLTKEIIYHIFTSFGMCNTSSLSNTVLFKEFLKTKIVKIKYDNDEEINHAVYSSQISINKESKFKVLIIDLTLDDIQEYCCVFQLDNLTIHGMRLRYDNEDTGIFKMYNETNSTWVDAPISNQAMILGGVEKIVSYGLLWESISDCEQLYNIGINLVSV